MKNKERVAQSNLLKCPNCGSEHLENDFDISFRYSSLIKCPDCVRKAKQDNKSIISDIPCF